MTSKKIYSMVLVASITSVMATSSFAANTSVSDVYQFGTNDTVGSSMLMRSPTGVSLVLSL